MEEIGIVTKPAEQVGDNYDYLVFVCCKAGQFAMRSLPFHSPFAIPFHYEIAIETKIS